MRRSSARITRTMAALYRESLALRQPGDKQSEKYWTVICELAPLLERQPWQVQILEALDEGEPPSWYRPDQVRDWYEAFAIGLELQKAAAVKA